jgi:carbon-monoxide dehydrogenase large subunit
MVRIADLEELTTPLVRIAEAAYLQPDRLPPGMEPGLESHYRYQPPPMVFSNAGHACVCEVDAETGVVRVLRWVASEDCGVMINPAIVEGQIAGGVVQAIGGVLFEHAAYDAYGNPVTATFKDYLLPTAHDVPEIEYCHISTPSDTEGGFKGVGEGGAIIGPPTLVNAVADALAPFGVSRCLELPLTPTRILALIEDAQAAR